MNAPIARLFGVVVVLFALLIVWTSRWTVFDANVAEQQPAERPHADRRAEDQARPDPRRRRRPCWPSRCRRRRHTWTRTYPTGPLFAQPVGYSIVAQGQAAGLEQSRGDGAARAPDRAELGVRPAQPAPVGDDVYTTLDPKAQQVAESELAGRAGSVVALDPQTGAVKVMYSNPSYDDNHPLAPGTGQLPVQPRDPGPLPAGLDVQGRDRDGGDRQRQVHAGLGRSTATRRSRSRACRWPTTATRASARSR